MQCELGYWARFPESLYKSRRGVSPNFHPRRVSLRLLVEQQIHPPPSMQEEKNLQKHKDLQSFNVNVFRNWYIGVH